MFRPFVFLAYLIGTIALTVVFRVAQGGNSFLTEPDIAALIGLSVGWYSHWLWSTDP